MIGLYKDIHHYHERVTIGRLLNHKSHRNGIMVDWTLERINSEAAQFAKENNYPVPKQVVLSDRMSKSWGRAYPYSRIIKLNKRFIELNAEDVVKALLEHEIVHLVLPNHKKGFKREMKKHGHGKHLHKTPGLSPIVVERFFYECEDCGKTYISGRRLNVKRYRCKVCKADIVFIKSVPCSITGSYQSNELSQIQLNQQRLLDY